MDRRQRKTRDAIFGAFTSLLEERPYHRITVQEIIDAADVGRATFYAHFETKDYLLKDLCEELFGHIIDTAMGHPHGHIHGCNATAADSVFLHLFRAENGKSAQNVSFMAVDFTGKRRMALRLLRVRVKKSENRAIVFIAASVPDGAEKNRKKFLFPLDGEQKACYYFNALAR